MVVVAVQDIVLALVRGERLLEVLLGTLGDVLATARGPHALDPGAPAIRARRFARPAADLHLALASPSAVLELFGAGHPGRAALALAPLRALQGAHALRRRAVEHVEYESLAWLGVVEAECAVQHSLVLGALGVLTRAVQSGTRHGRRLGRGGRAPHLHAASTRSPLPTRPGGLPCAAPLQVPCLPSTLRAL